MATIIRFLATGALSAFLCLGLGGCSALFYKHKLASQSLPVTGLGNALTISTGTPAFAVHGAIDLSGNGLAVWQQTVGSVNNIFASRYGATSGWSSPVSLQTGTSFTAINPQIAMDWTGNGIAVWQQWSGLNSYDAYANVYNASSGTWSGAVMLDTTIYSSENLQIAMNANGDALVIWEQFNSNVPAHYNVFANRYTSSNTTWSGSVQVNTGTVSGLKPAISIDTVGNGVAAWQQASAGHTHIMASRYAAGGTWSAPAQIDTAPALDAQNVRLAADASSNAVALWEQSDGTRTHIIGNRFVSGTGWGAPTAALDTATAGDAANAALAFDSNGGFFAAWHQGDLPHSTIYASRSADGGATWGAAQVISSSGDAEAINVRVAADSGGEATAIWEQYTADTRDIYANHYLPSSGWSSKPTAIQNEGINLSDPAEPQVCMNPAGKTLTVWTAIDLVQLERSIDALVFSW